MHSMRRMKKWFLAGLAATGLLMVSSTGVTQDKDIPRPAPVPKMDRTGALIVPLQGSVRLQMRNKKLIRAISFDKEGVVKATPDALQPNAAIIFGLGVGTVILEMTDVDGGKEQYEIVVQQDLELLRTTLRRVVPTANIDLIPGLGGTIVLAGYVARAEDVNTVVQVASSVGGQNANIVNAIQIGGVHQVQLDVVVASVNRSKARQRGFNFIINGTTVSTGSILGGLTSSTGSTGSATSTAAVGLIPSAASAIPSASPNLIFGIVPTQIQALLQALKTEGLAKTLAEPRVVTQSGRPANFQVGGQQATLSAASGINGPGVAYQSIGTQLDFLPLVYGNGKIYLEVSPTIRTVNTALGITTSFGTVPGFDVQTIHTSVVLESGQTFAIGGLIQNSLQASAARVPVLGEIPFLGALFNVISQTETEQETIILVTPHLVDPMACNQVPTHLPGRETRPGDDFEFFMESMLELPRYQRNVFEGRRYRAPWKNDPTAQQFPCGANGGTNGNCASGTCGNGSPMMGMNSGTTTPTATPNTGKLPTPAQLPPSVVPPRSKSGVMNDVDNNSTVINTNDPGVQIQVIPPAP